MEHKSIDTLHDMLKDAAAQVSAGSSYIHYKDSLKRYIVTGLSIMEDTDEIAVKYAMADVPDIEFVRPLAQWVEAVEWNGQQVPRFTRV